MTLEFDILQTITIAVVVLSIGAVIKNRIYFFQKFFIPNPVIGGIIVALIALIGYSTGAFFFEFDTTLQNIFMTAFFTAVGFSCDFKAFKKGGKLGIILTLVTIVLISVQNVIGIVLAKVLDINPLIGLATSSVALTGGHGTSAAFGPVFETYNASGATTVALSAATFGLVAGGLVGGPVSRYLIKKHNLITEAKSKQLKEAKEAVTEEVQPYSGLSEGKMFSAAYQLIVAMGIGTIVSLLIESVGLIFPGYIGGLLMGIVIRNLGEFSGKYNVPTREINTIGQISLSLFIAMALMTLKLWELKDLAIPMIIILTAQVIFIILFIVFFAFRVLGKDYDSAVMVSGVTGFGLGAMPVAVANMQTFMEEYPASPTVFFVITGIGTIAIDISNSFLVTFFVNVLT